MKENEKKLRIAVVETPTDMGGYNHQEGVNDVCETCVTRHILNAYDSNIGKYVTIVTYDINSED